MSSKYSTSALHHLLHTRPTPLIFSKADAIPLCQSPAHNTGSPISSRGIVCGELDFFVHSLTKKSPVRKKRKTVFLFLLLFTFYYFLFFLLMNLILKQKNCRFCKKWGVESPPAPPSLSIAKINVTHATPTRGTSRDSLSYLTILPNALGLT